MRSGYHNETPKWSSKGGILEKHLKLSKSNLGSRYRLGKKLEWPEWHKPARNTREE